MCIPLTGVRPKDGRDHNPCPSFVCPFLQQTSLINCVIFPAQLILCFRIIFKPPLQAAIRKNHCFPEKEHIFDIRGWTFIYQLWIAGLRSIQLRRANDTTIKWASFPLEVFILGSYQINNFSSGINDYGVTSVKGGNVQQSDQVMRQYQLPNLSITQPRLISCSSYISSRGWHELLHLQIHCPHFPAFLITVRGKKSLVISPLLPVLHPFLSQLIGQNQPRPPEPRLRRVN